MSAPAHNVYRSLMAMGRRGAALGLLLALAACSTPAPEAVHDVSTADAIPDHTPFANLECVTCHELDRPPPAIDAASGAEVVHGGGEDCGGCHVAGGTSWRAFTAFNHAPTPSACGDCHASARPAGIVNGMLHTFPNVGDCADCHAGTAGITWSGATFGHDPVPTTCDACHAADRPTTVVNGFSHAAGGSGDCAACHSSPGVRWSDGFFSHSPAPATCAGCHAGARPVGLVGDPPFDHAQGGTGDCKSCHAPPGATQTDWSGGSFSHNPAPATCSGCHLGDRPVGPAGTPPFDHANAGTGDCVACHRLPDATQVDWSGGSFSHSPAPASCSGCHAGDRPTGPVGTPAFDHAIAGTGDCKSCHAPPGATQTDWSGGNFSHSPAPSTCIDCHLADRPVGPTTGGFDHALGGTGDCAACHVEPGVRWSGAVAGFDHATLAPTTRCDSCHAGDSPAAAVNVPWPGHPAQPNQFLHTIVAATDCRSCHLDPGGAWSGGRYAHDPNPGRCSVCHLNQRPIGPVGPVGSLFDHANGGSGDCVACHVVASPSKTDWTGGDFTHTSALTSCSNCHEGRRPTDTLHATQAAGDCASCHAMQSPTKNDWAGGSFSHVPKPANCAGCHTGDKPANAVRGTGTSTDGRTYTNDYLHGLVAGDCAGCHDPRSATPVDWTGGRYSHSPAPAACSSCHTITKPPAGATSLDHSQSGLGDCRSCHLLTGQRWTGASALPAIVTLTPPAGRTWASITAPHPTIDPNKAGLACATCHGTNTSARIISYDHAFPVQGVKCVYCHYTNQTVTSAAVDTKSHQSTSPAKDCTASGCHRPTYPAWSTTNRRFSGGRWDEP